MSEASVRILLVEDNAGDARLLRETLRDAEGLSFELTQVGRLDEARRCLSGGTFDVLLLDLYLPDSQGVDTVKRIIAAAPHLPVLVLTGTDDVAVGTESVRCGAQDYLVKGQADHRLLPRAMRYAIERKRSELALQDTVNRFHVVLSSMYTSVLLVSDAGRVEFANQALCDDFGLRQGPQELFGLESDAAIEKLKAAYLHPEQAVRRIGEIIRRRQAVKGEELAMRDGSTRLRDFVPLSVGGKSFGRLWIQTDITQRKRAEEALERTRLMLSEGARIAHLGTWQWIAQTAETIWSEEEFRIYGLEPAGNSPSYQELMTRHFHPEDAATLDHAFRQAIGSGSVFENDHRIVRPDGSVRFIHNRANPQFDASGKLLGYIGVTLDITQRKQAEEALKAAKDSAERAKAAAEEASKAKDHFLAVLSHELRNPLNPVLATASALARDPQFDGETREMMQIISRNVEMEARLIDDLLDVTRIERGKVELHKSVIDLRVVIERAVEVCIPDIQGRKLEFGLDAPDGPYHMEADAARLQQIFWNLLKNAVKFTPAGGCVGIRCRRKGDIVVAEVSDSGEGIESENLGRIFNAFEQAGRAVTRQFGGLGLGLTISKAMVELHGGSIEAHSQGRGKGATFTVRLPLLPVPSGLSAALPVAQASSPAAVPSLRILLVEDHGDTARVMRRLLGAGGHDVAIAGDVATARNLAGERTFDLLISDLGLPDGTGLDLMRALRAKGFTGPGIALSGYGQEHDLRASREAGFNIHLIKPVDLARLTQAIASLAPKPQ